MKRLNRLPREMCLYASAFPYRSAVVVAALSASAGPFTRSDRLTLGVASTFNVALNYIFVKYANL